MNNLTDRIANLSPAKLELLAQRLKLKRAQGTSARQIPRRDASVISPPLSLAQQRLWFLDQLMPGSPIYNIPNIIRIKGPLDVAVMERSLNEIVRRHEALRTTFGNLDGQPKQVIAQDATLQLPVIDLMSLAGDEREAEAKRLALKQSAQPFDLTRDALLRASLLRLSVDEYLAVLTMHHIVSDGWSLNVLISELATIYAAFSEGARSPLPELPIQYADYAVWQQEWLGSGMPEQQLAYWKHHLTGAPTLELPLDKPRPAVQGFNGSVVPFRIPEILGEQLRELSRGEDVTLFMTLLAAFDVLLYRYTGQDDVVVGTTIAGRNRAELEPLIGFFINTLPLRTDLSGNPTFRQLLQRVQETALGAYAHQDVPFEKLVEELQPVRAQSHPPLFQVMFALHNAPQAKFELKGLSLREEAANLKTSKFDLTLSIFEGEEILTGSFTYNTDLFEAATLERMAGHFNCLLAGIVANPDDRLSALPILPVAERHQLLVEWNETQRSYPAKSCLHELIEAQAERTPEAVAVVYEDKRLSYRELETRANQLAHRLRAQGVGADTLVGVAMERSVEMVVALLGVLKAGGAYLPLDPEYPSERLAFMLRDAAPLVLLTQSHLLDKLPLDANQSDGQGNTVQVICLDTEREILEQRSAEQVTQTGTPRSDTSAQNLAYVIYTSGSTGQPKAAMNSHRAIVNRLLWMQDEYQLNAHDCVLQKTPFSFDVSVWEFFWPLVTGARLVLARPGGHRDASYLIKLIARAQVTTLHFVPSMLQALLDESDLSGCASLKRVICSGEALSVELQERFFTRLSAPQLHNLYGPTEAAVDVTFWACERESARRSVPIGRPIANLEMYILDAHLAPVPVGVAGELYIGGVGVGRGYLRRAGLTAERFIPHPYGSGAGGGRLYRTGDVGRYLASGEIEYLGRSDQQVKVRGYRIELGEIEAALMSAAQVREAVVVVRADASTGDKKLAAYVVPAHGLFVEVNQLRSFVRGSLPEYMIPSDFVVLDELPLLPNGKVNRKALPAPQQEQRGAEEDDASPRTAVEEILAGSWADLLGIARPGVHANFFDAGGHSLLGARLMSQVRERFQVDVPLRSLFDAPTIAGLAQMIEREIQDSGGVRLPPLRPVARDGNMPLSFAQQRLWFLQQLEPASTVYNIPLALRLNGQLDAAALSHSLNEIVQRHEVLRTHFVTLQRVPAQLVTPQLRLEVPLTDLSQLSEPEREAQVLRLSGEHARQPFDLSTGPLLRAQLLRLADTEHLALLTMHHIVSDGWSMGVLVREVAALYAAFSRGEASPLPPLPIQYADYALWQREWLTGQRLADQLAYWQQQLAGAPGVSELPGDRARPEVASYGGARQPVRIAQQLSEDIGKLSRREGATLFMTLLAAFQVLLSHYSAQPDVVTGTDVANRNRAETEGLIGFFVNQLPLRTKIRDEESFRDLLKQVREVALSAYAHQDVPFEKVVEAIRPERNLNHMPLFQVKLILQNTQERELNLPGLTLSPVKTGDVALDFDLLLVLFETPEGLHGWIHYARDLYEAATVSRFFECYLLLLTKIIAQPDVRIGELKESLGAADKQHLTDREKELEQSRLQKFKSVRRRRLG